MGRFKGLLPFMLATQLFSSDTQRNVEYGRVGETRLLLDAAIPEGKGPFPAVILVHGGGWVGGNRQFNVEPLFEPLTRAGFAWFSISYRLATNLMDFGVAVDDVLTAVKHVRARAKEYNIDPEKIGVVGESAGAHLAALAVERAPKSVAAIVALYPPTDLVLLARHSGSVPESIRQALRSVGMEQIIVGFLRQMSPIEHVNADLPPFLLVHGTSDSIVPYNQSERMLEKLLASGIQAELIAVEGGGHGLRGWESSSKHVAYRQKMIDWLSWQLAGQHVRAGVGF